MTRRLTNMRTRLALAGAVVLAVALAVAVSAVHASVSSSTSTPSKATLAAGKVVFKSNCALCHTLADAKSHGSIGPNLDKLKPSDALVIHQVTNGGGGMPSFRGRLSAAKIKAVAAYVSHVAGKKKSSGGGGGGAGGLP
jgi:cytochrome c6